MVRALAQIFSEEENFENILLKYLLPKSRSQYPELPSSAVVHLVLSRLCDPFRAASFSDSRRTRCSRAHVSHFAHFGHARSVAGWPAPGSLYKPLLCFKVTPLQQCSPGSFTTYPQYCANGPQKNPVDNLVSAYSTWYDNNSGQPFYVAVDGE